MRPSLTGPRKISVRRRSLGAKSSLKFFLPRIRARRCSPFARREILESMETAAMTKSAQLLLFALLGLAFFAFSPDSNTALAQGTLTGEWTASVDSAKFGKWNKSDKWDRKADDGPDADDRD